MFAGTWSVRLMARTREAGNNVKDARIRAVSCIFNVLERVTKISSELVLNAVKLEIISVGLSLLNVRAHYYTRNIVNKSTTDITNTL